MNAEKKALRVKLMQEIRDLPEDYVAESDSGLFEMMTALPEFRRAEVIFTYYSMGREPDTRRIVDLALRLGKTVTLPVCAKGGMMDARAISSTDELCLTAYGLLEPLASDRIVPPERLDFIIVPALAYDRDSYRLGYGGGFYDRFLIRTAAFTAGAARERLLADTLPREAHDVAVRCVVTERKARLRGGASQEA